MNSCTTGCRAQRCDPHRAAGDRCRQRILIVDDEAAVADLIEAVLVGEGYTVAIARDGVQGILLARDWKPDLVLMDIMLPGIDGTTAIRRLKSDPETAELPIVAMSAGRTIRRQSNELPMPMRRWPSRSISKHCSPRSSFCSLAAAPNNSAHHTQLSYPPTDRPSVTFGVPA